MTRPAEAPADDPLDPPTRGERMSAEVRERVGILSERFEEPIQTVTTLTQKTMALFPVRVWRWFLFRNGFLLSSGMSYQAIFAVFAAVYVLFAGAGLFLTGNDDTLLAIVNLINTYVPGLIGPDGAITPAQLSEAADSSRPVRLDRRRRPRRLRLDGHRVDHVLAHGRAQPVGLPKDMRSSAA